MSKGENKMKLEKQNKSFEPITLTFESQDEVDLLFSILNHFAIFNALKLNGTKWDKLRLELPKSENYKKYHIMLCNSIV